MARRDSKDFLLHDEAPDLRVLVAGREQPLLAHHDVLKLYSKCVRDLPRSADSTPTTWDLRALVLEGESRPVAAEVVESWLDLVYSHVDASRRMPTLTGLEDARPLLLFTDAVGTVRLALNDLCRALTDNPELSLTIRLGGLEPQATGGEAAAAVENEEGEEQGAGAEGGAAAAAAAEQEEEDEEEGEEDEGEEEGRQGKDEGPQPSRLLQVVLRGHLYCLNPADGLVDVPIARPHQRTTLAPPAEFAASVRQCSTSVAAALEEWLYLSSRLRLVPLARLLIDFVKAHLMLVGSSIVYGDSAASIYSPRVLQCMPPELLMEAFLRDAFTHRPASVQLQAVAATATFVSPLAAAWFAEQPGVSRTLDVNSNVQHDGRSLLGNSLPLDITLGGPGASTTDGWMQQALERLSLSGAGR